MTTTKTRALLFRLTTKLLLVLIGICSSCSGDVESEYSRKIAFLRVQPVSAAAPLRTALTSPGEWCLATVGSTQLNFRNVAGQSASIALTATSIYSRPQLIAGAIIGTPRLPNTSGIFETRVYDAVCPSCYESAAAIVRTLTLSDSLPSQAECGRCRRAYDLELSGIVVRKGRSDNQQDPRLYRYRHSYQATTDIFVIQN